MISAHDTRFFGHPRGLATCFFTEMWERFSYYGMRALLILFMTAPLRGADSRSIFPLRASCTDCSPLWYMRRFPGAGSPIGSSAATRRRAGGVFIAIGNFVSAFPDCSVLRGLVLVVIGTGLLKPNVSAIVGQLYAKRDPRRDSGFSHLLHGHQSGRVLIPSVRLRCCALGWRDGFLLAGIGMTLELRSVCPRIPRIWATQAQVRRTGRHCRATVNSSLELLERETLLAWRPRWRCSTS